jgi:phosphoglycolate phosphatase
LPRRYKLLIFDWDGTLMDSTAAIAEALQGACGDLGLRVPTEQEARHIIGLGLDDAMRALLPEVAPAIYPRIVERYREHFLARDAATRLFPGASGAIRSLHEAGHLLAIATGKSRRGLGRALRSTGLEPFFHLTRCADEGYTKPDPEMLRCLLADLGVDAGNAVVIGDTTHDLRMANAAGIDAVGVAYGAHPRDELLECRPVACFDRHDELWAWLAASA